MKVVPASIAWTPIDPSVGLFGLPWATLPEKLAGIFPLSMSSVVLSWGVPNIDRASDDGHCVECNLLCLAWMLCPLCAPFCSSELKGVDGMEYLFLQRNDRSVEKLGGQISLDAEHVKVVSSFCGVCGGSSSRRIFQVGGAKLSGDEGFGRQLVLFDRIGDEVLTIEVKNLWQDPENLLPNEIEQAGLKDPDHPQLVLHALEAAGRSALAMVEGLLGGDVANGHGPLPMAEGIDSTIQQYGWQTISANDWVRFKSEAGAVSLSTTPEAGLACCVCIACPCFSIPCWGFPLEDFVDRVRTFRFRPFATGSGLELEVGEEPVCPACNCFRKRGPRQPRVRRGLTVTSVQASNEQKGVFVQTAQHAFLHLNVKSDDSSVARAVEAVLRMLAQPHQEELVVPVSGIIGSAPPQHVMTCTTLDTSSTSTKNKVVNLTRSAAHLGLLRREKSTGVVDNGFTTEPCKQESNIVIGKDFMAASNDRPVDVDDTSDRPQTQGNACESSIEESATKLLISALRRSYEKEDVDVAVERFAGSRGQSQPTPDQILEAVLATSMLRRAPMAAALSTHCGGPFPSTLIAAAVGRAKHRWDAELVAVAFAPHIVDPEAFQAVVLDGTHLKDSYTIPSRRKAVLATLPAPK